MMKIYILGILFFLFFNLCFVFENEKSRKEFKTFNEYRLMGVPFTDANRELYVIVDEYDDSIKVQISDDLSNPIIYINKGKYWFSISSKCLDSGGKVKAMKYIEKYIYNDTILKYNYTVFLHGDTVSRGNESIIIETEKSSLNLSYDKEISDMILEKGDQMYRFEILKLIVNNYEGIFVPMTYPIIVYPIRNFIFNTKKISNDTLYIYNKSNIKYKPSCLYDDVRLLNSLGEYDPQRGISILGKMDVNKRCR